MGDSIGRENMFRMPNLAVYLFHKAIAYASLWITFIVKYHNRMYVSSKIVNMNICETFGDVFLLVFTREVKEVSLQK